MFTTIEEFTEANKGEPSKMKKGGSIMNTNDQIKILLVCASSIDVFVIFAFSFSFCLLTSCILISIS